MAENPLLKLRGYGQSIWLDFIQRGILVSGELQRLIDEDGLGGETSNPAIFDKAIAGSHDYDEAITALARQGKSALEIYETLAIEDVQRAADIFRPLFERTGGNDSNDGFISLEVSPYLAYDTAGTIAEARRFWQAVSRPNLFIKIPATKEGLDAIRQAISEGINVNVTLLFGLERYRQVAEAYIAGLEERARRGQPLKGIFSVASFFLSRIDVLVDPMLEQAAKGAGAPEEAERLGKLARLARGRVAIASAKLAYQIYKEVFSSERFRVLAAKGANRQHLLWASTGTKNPEYSDVMYVEELIGPQTVNTLPLETINAYRDHGKPAPRLETGLDEARAVLQALADLGIDLDKVTQQLEDEGVLKFQQSLDKLLATLEKKRAAAAQPVARVHADVGALMERVEQRLARMDEEHFGARLWRKDATLWSSDPAVQKQIGNSLGWLTVAGAMRERVQELQRFAAEVRRAGFRHVLDMGMGGSTLAPLMFATTFAPQGDGLPVSVLDTTDPVTIRRIERQLPLAETLFIVASKSGTTAEPLAFQDYFYARLQAIKGEKAGENFVTITDPGSLQVKMARELGFRHIFTNFADIGGRYSALSYFGLVPAALMGLDINRLLEGALELERASAGTSAKSDPALLLGAIMGESGLPGPGGARRDKVTLIIPPRFAAFGMWLEQLLAESTGKDGTGLLPVAGEPLGDAALYGQDRLFVHLSLRQGVGNEEAVERHVAALRRAGQPVVTVELDDLMDLGQQFLLWEVATAAAGAIMGINPFDQPNVQESKDNTNRLLKAVVEQGQLPQEEPVLAESSLSFYADRPAATGAEVIAHLLAQGKAGDYLALMAYLPEDETTQPALERLRLSLRDGTRLATTLGFGPRFLHSTGQFHKGGSNTGLFLQFTADDAEDAPLPGRPYGFSLFKQAQALGDLEALRKHGRRVVRVHLHGDIQQGLAALEDAVQAALHRLGA